MSDAIAHKKKWCWSAVGGLGLSLLPATVYLLVGKYGWPVWLDRALGWALGWLGWTGAFLAALIILVAPFLCILLSAGLCFRAVGKVGQRGAWLGIVGLVIVGGHAPWLIHAMRADTTRQLPVLAWGLVGLLPAAIALCRYCAKRTGRANAPACEATPPE